MANREKNQKRREQKGLYEVDCKGWKKSGKVSDLVILSMSGLQLNSDFPLKMPG